MRQYFQCVSAHIGNIREYLHFPQFPASAWPSLVIWAKEKAFPWKIFPKWGVEYLCILCKPRSIKGALATVWKRGAISIGGISFLSFCGNPIKVNLQVSQRGATHTSQIWNHSLNFQKSSNISKLMEQCYQLKWPASEMQLYPRNQKYIHRMRARVAVLCAFVIFWCRHIAI